MSWRAMLARQNNNSNSNNKLLLPILSLLLLICSRNMCTHGFVIYNILQQTNKTCNHHKGMVHLVLVVAEKIKIKMQMVSQTTKKFLKFGSLQNVITAVLVDRALEACQRVLRRGAIYSFQIITFTPFQITRPHSLLYLSLDSCLLTWY